MNLNSRSQKIIPLILVFVMSFAPLTLQARDSLESLRNDLNAAVTQINTLQNQNNTQQTQINALQAQLATFPNFYSIGNTGPAGGIVFHVTDAGAHGLEASPEDQGVAKWGCYGISIQGADATAAGSGAQNTIDILAGCNETGIAAQIADNYELNGFADWYLPSKDELNLMSSKTFYLGSSNWPYHWSSSESDSENAWFQHLENGGVEAHNKLSVLTVRAIRNF
jgi:hypothetical protein